MEIIYLVAAAFFGLGLALPARWGARLAALAALPSAFVVFFLSANDLSEYLLDTLLLLGFSLFGAAAIVSGVVIRAVWEWRRHGGLAQPGADRSMLTGLSGLFSAGLGLWVAVAVFGLFCMGVPLLGFPVLAHFGIGTGAFFGLGYSVFALRNWRRWFGFGLCLGLWLLIVDSGLRSPARILNAAERFSREVPRCLVLGDGRAPDTWADLMVMSVPKSGGRSAIILHIAPDRCYRWSFKGSGFNHLPYDLSKIGLCAPHRRPLLGSSQGSP